MLKRILLLAIILLSVFLVSCSSGTGNHTVDKRVNGESKNDIPSVNIYLMNNCNKCYSGALRSYDGITVEAKYFSDIEEYRNKITTELLAGEGPDLILIGSGAARFSSITKLFSSETLADLNEIIKEDKGINIDDYNNAVLDSGAYCGKRYVIPLSFKVPSFYTTNSILAKEGINVSEEEWNWDSMVETAVNFFTINKGNGKCLFESEFGPEITFMNFLSASNFQFIDYERKKSYFNTPEFEEFLEIFKLVINPVLAPSELSQKYNSSKYDLLKNEKVLMLYDDAFGNAKSFYTNNSNIKGELNEEMKVYPIPSFKGGKSIVAVTSEAIGINSNCKYKMTAFQYIKKLLSEDYYKLHYDNIYYATVNNKAFEEEKNYYSSESVAIGGIWTPLSENLVKRLDNIMENINGCSLYKYDPVIRVIRNDLNEYLEEKKTLKQTVKSIDNKVKLLLNE